MSCGVTCDLLDPLLEVSKPSEMLGVFFGPDGNGISHMQQMNVKGSVWLDPLDAKPLPSRNTWLSVHLQLHPGMAWGLPTVILVPNKMEKIIQSLYFCCLPKLGVNICITREWRMLTPRYYGVGMPNFAVNCIGKKAAFLLLSFQIILTLLLNSQPFTNVGGLPQPLSYHMLQL